MTLKTRLAGMMVLLLVAVVAVQFVLAERERRQLGARLQQMSGELDRSTAVFVQRAHEMALAGPPRQLESILARVLPDSVRALGEDQTSVRVFVGVDTTLRRRAEAAELGAGGVETWQHEVVVRDSAGGQGATRLQRIVWMRPRHAAFDTVLHGTLPRRRRAGPPPGDRDFVINLPLPRLDSDSLYTVQVRYSYASLAEELARSRRRSLVWLALLLGVGGVAALGVAGQFTRPIRTLEASFGRVRQGDLDVQVRPERRDEIGHLTRSFNEMVARLRESQRLAERLVESEHLASLGRLAAGVAHEIRNPLNAILLNLQQMHDRVRAGMAAGPAADPANGRALEELDKYHARMSAEIGRLERLVGSFLDLAKSGELRFGRVDVAAGVRGAVELFRPLAEERGVTLEAVGPEGLEIDADPARLPAVWNNLLANAIEATPRGGRVSLRARRDGDEVEVVCQDTGPGIAPETRARVWEPFWSGREGGTGLGLAIVRSTVEHHGGRVDLDCPPGGGTALRVRLPAARPGAGPTEDA